MQNKYFKFLLIILVAAIIVPQVALAAWWNPFSWGIWNRIFHFQQQEQKIEKPIGGDKDSHGCLVAAGYSWCEVKNKCLRVWEEKCEAIADYFKIYPVALKFENLKNITDLVYFVNNISGGKQVDFSTQLLQDKNKYHYEQYCGIDYNPMGAIQIFQKDPGSPDATYLVKSNNFYVTYIKPNDRCYSVAKEQIDLLFSALKTITKAESETSKNVALKTYINNDFGFEFKYPDFFKVTFDKNNRESLSLNLGYKNYVHIGDISMMVFRNNNAETAAQYFERKKNEAAQGFASKCPTCANMDKDAEFYDCLLKKPGIIKIAGQNGFFCPGAYRPIYIFYNDYIYEFHAYDETNPSYEIYKEILSTFKFTK